MTGASTSIRFKEVDKFKKTWVLQFMKDDTWYSVRASESGVKAAKISENELPVRATHFNVIALERPNEPYGVLRSTNKKKGKHPEYLSSDGAGKMTLKRWNLPDDDPRRATDEVDPALLFRVVRPLGED